MKMPRGSRVGRGAFRPFGCDRIGDNNNSKTNNDNEKPKLKIKFDKDKTKVEILGSELAQLCNEKMKFVITVRKDESAAQEVEDIVTIEQVKKSPIRAPHHRFSWSTPNYDDVDSAAGHSDWSD